MELNVAAMQLQWPQATPPPSGAATGGRLLQPSFPSVAEGAEGEGAGH